jgi:hypothetical protein
MPDGEGGGIRGSGRDQTACHYRVRIDLASDGDHRKCEDDPNSPHGWDY